MTKVDLSVIIVNYNTKGYLVRTLKSVFTSDEKINFEVIVVDNASSDGSSEMVAKKFPKALLIKSSKNIGFGQGNNLGIKEASGKYILLLNPDIKLVEKNTFSEMVEWMDGHTEVGVSTCALLNPDGSFQGSGGCFPTLFKVFAWLTFLDDLPLIDRLIKPYHPMHSWSFYKGEGYFKMSREQDWVTGAFFMTRREVLDQVGLFDNDYFAYVEEVDLCYRVKKAGWQVWYLPSPKVVHFGQVTSSSRYAAVNEFKGLRTFYKKHFASWQTVFLRLMLKVGAVLRMIIFGLAKGKASFNTYAEAFSVV